MQLPLPRKSSNVSRAFAVFLFTGAAWAASPHVDTHLALGDSITFGLDPARLLGPAPYPNTFT
jgi:hypothetical protein